MFLSCLLEGVAVIQKRLLTQSKTFQTVFPFSTHLLFQPGILTTLVITHSMGGNNGLALLLS